MIIVAYILCDHDLQEDNFEFQIATVQLRKENLKNKTRHLTAPKLID